MKKTLFLLLFTIYCFAVFSQDITFEYDGNYYQTMSDSTVKVTWIYGANYSYLRSSNGNIPMYVSHEGIDYKVVRIGSDAFQCAPITRLVMPNSISVIEQYAFDDCSHLQSCYLGDKIDSIEQYAFYRCGTLDTLYVGSSLIFIGNRAFYQSSINTLLFNAKNLQTHSSVFNDKGINTIIIGDSVKVINSWIFRGNTTLRSLSLGNNVDTIKNSAFEYCRAIRTIQIGDGVKYIGIRAFYNCDNLDTIELGCNVNYIGTNSFLCGEGITLNNLSIIHYNCKKLLVHNR